MIYLFISAYNHRGDISPQTNVVLATTLHTDSMRDTYIIQKGHEEWANNCHKI